MRAFCNTHKDFHTENTEVSPLDWNMKNIYNIVMTWTFIHHSKFIVFIVNLIIQ